MFQDENVKYVSGGWIFGDGKVHNKYIDTYKFKCESRDGNENENEAKLKLEHSGDEYLYETNSKQPPKLHPPHQYLLKI